MSSVGRRLAAVAAAVAVAVLTGAAAGLAMPQTVCHPGVVGQVCTVDRFAPAPAAIGAGGALLAAAVVLVLLLVPGRPAGGEPATAVLRLPGPAGVDRADRAALIRACIYVRDRTTSRALADRLGSALRDAGVRTVEPAGTRFDPACHEAGGSMPSRDPAKIGTIAAVEVAGYTDRDGSTLRVPVVTVFREAP